MTAITRLQTHMLANIGAWIIFGLLVTMWFVNYAHCRELRRACEITGPHDVQVDHPRNLREELDSICIANGGDDDDLGFGWDP
jgi:hypothetical protein